MEKIFRCRKCGNKMKSTRLDNYHVKTTCSCGFIDYAPAPSASRAINPNLSRDNLLQIKFGEKGEFFFQLDRADRERMELITIEEISMLASSDYDLDEVLKPLVEKTAKRLGVDVCSVYLWDGEKMVLRASHGLSQDAVGKASLKPGEGVTGTAVKEKRPILVSDVSEDKRYKIFPETREEQYRLKSMYSYPIFTGDEPLGVLNAQTVIKREFREDEIYFVSVIANLILGAVKMRKRR